MRIAHNVPPKTRPAFALAFLLLFHDATLASHCAKYTPVQSIEIQVVSMSNQKSKLYQTKLGLKNESAIYWDVQ